MTVAGVPIGRLLRMADLTEDTDATRAQLRRDLAVLRHGGWDIRNVAGEGEDGRYVLHAQDNTLALLLTPGEIAALREVWTAASIDHAKPPPFMGRLHHAVRDRSLTSFGYDGRRRVVHPDALYSTGSGWVLLARERGGGSAEGVRDRVDPRPGGRRAGHGESGAGAAGRTARPDAVAARSADAGPAGRADPRSSRTCWPCCRGRRSCRPEIGERAPDEILVELVVTNQATFRARLYALGLRARVLEPASLVDEIVTNLRAVAGTGS